MANKLQYLSRSFSRTTNKVYEHYVITSIYHRINNFELKPVTQQKVVSSENPDKYYLLDLYFPQINYGVEVDEPAHKSEVYSLGDLKRSSDIIKQIGCNERRVTITEDYDIKSVNKQIDEIVTEINMIINNLQDKLVWRDNEDLISEVKKKKEFNTAVEVDFKNFTSIWEIITGIKKNRNRICYSKISGNYYLWVPRMTIEIDGVKIGDPNWENTLYDYDNQTYIKEKNTSGRIKPLIVGPVDNGKVHVTFMQMKDSFGQDCVRFVGMFQHVENLDPQTRLYKKISDKYSW